MEHAQHIANLVVDEARLCGNIFEWTNEEQSSLISNYDVFSVSLPVPAGDQIDELQFYRTEMYLF